MILMKTSKEGKALCCLNHWSRRKNTKKPKHKNTFFVLERDVTLVNNHLEKEAKEHTEANEALIITTSNKKKKSIDGQMQCFLFHLYFWVPSRIVMTFLSIYHWMLCQCLSWYSLFSCMFFRLVPSLTTRGQQKANLWKNWPPNN